MQAPCMALLVVAACASDLRQPSRGLERQQLAADVGGVVLEFLKCC